MSSLNLTELKKIAEDDELCSAAENEAVVKLITNYEKAVEALQIYAMTNETFPEYGDVARKTLKELGEV